MNPSSSKSPTNRVKRPIGLSIAVPEAPVPDRLVLPNPIINYEDLKKLSTIGSGSAATVYKVERISTGEFYALKVLTVESSLLSKLIKRELESFRRLSHPNIVKYFGVYEEEGKIQYLLEMMRGGSLAGHTISDEKQLAMVAKQVLSAMYYMKEQKVIHRDIKPANVLFGDDYTDIKVTDFGIARTLDRSSEQCSTVVGTIAYLSPEVLNTELHYDGHLADIWSFGVTMLHLYSGEYPYGNGKGIDGLNSFELSAMILSSPPPVAPATSSSNFKEFISKCLVIVEKRSSAKELLDHSFLQAG